MLNCYLLTQTVLFMKYNQKLFIKNFLSGKICLVLAAIQKDLKFFDSTNKNVIGKMKNEFGGVIIVELVGLKPKMYSIKKIDDKE